MIRPETARQLGYQWHGGRSSPLYAFASSGIVADPAKLRAEIADNLAYAKEQERPRQARELGQLDEFVAAKLEQHEGDWLAPWAYRGGSTGYLAVMIFTPNGNVRERHRTLRGVLDYAKRRGVKMAEVWQLRPLGNGVRVRLTFGDGFYTLWTADSMPNARQFLARQWPGITIKEIEG
jgi:hypothetical protein